MRAVQGHTTLTADTDLTSCWLGKNNADLVKQLLPASLSTAWVRPTQMWGLMLGIPLSSFDSRRLPGASTSFPSYCDLPAGEINDEVVQRLISSFDTDNNCAIDTD